MGAQDGVPLPFEEETHQLQVVFVVFHQEDSPSRHRLSNSSITIQSLLHFVKCRFITGLWYIPPILLFFVADGRSPTSRTWLTYWLENGHEVHLVSTYPCEPPEGLASFHILAVALGR